MARFYVPENHQYTILDSLHDSVRFARHCLVPYHGHLSASSSFVDPNGTPMLWHSFGPLEGPGWAANAVGGAFELHWYGRVMGQPDVQVQALGLLDHVLDDGFVDWTTGFVKPYRLIPEDRFVLNYESNDAWFCPGSLARIGYQFLCMADMLPGDDARVPRLREAATRLGLWMAEHVRPLPSGWLPRRSYPDGSPFPYRPDGRSEDPLFESSADGLFILELWDALTARHLADYSAVLGQMAQHVMERGGIFGSINHDTYDEHEDVAYAVAFRLFRRMGRARQDQSLTRFAYEVALEGLRQFEMKEDRHGVATRGLLWMERTWDTAYLWENAHAAQAYLEAYVDTRRVSFLRKGLTILRAIARHHHGAQGFLTEGVDWNNHVSARHHVDGAEFGDICYTEPLLNNLHVAQPTLYYLAQIALQPE
jgi:hypothetical protein